MEYQTFSPTPVTCRKCGTTIRSDYPGEFVWCKCKAIAVDQTRYYSRYIGDPRNFIMEKSDNNNSSE